MQTENNQTASFEVDAQTEAAFTLVKKELEKALKKYPLWPTDPLHALAVLGEEFGELTKDTLQLCYEPHKTTKENLKAEAVQTAAMAIRYLVGLNHYEFKEGPQHKIQKEAV